MKTRSLIFTASLLAVCVAAGIWGQALPGTAGLALSNAATTVGGTSCALGSSCTPAVTVNGTTCTLGSSCTPPGSSTTSTGAIASLPGSPASGDVYFPTDSLYDFLRYSGSAWAYFYHGAQVTRFDPTGYSLINNGDGHASVSTQTNGVTTLTVTSNGAADSIHSYEVATPGTPWTRTWRFVTQTFDQSFNGCGLTLRENSTGKRVIYGLVTEKPGSINFPYIEAARFTNATTFGALLSNQQQMSLYGGGPLMVWRIANDGTTLTFSYSTNNGVSFLTLATATVTGSFTTAPDNMGVYCNPNNATNSYTNSITVISVD